MSASMFPASDECASIMACPALGLEACLESGRNSASSGPRLGARHAGRNQHPTLKAIFAVSPAHGLRRGEPSGQTRKEVNK